MRTFAQATLEELADHASVPVINALTDEHHPCQALADLLTLRERFGSLHGLRLAYLGDANNVAHSLLEAGALTGASVVVACPRGYGPDDEVLDRAFHLQADHGGLLEITHDPRHAVAGAHAVYTDVWVSMGEEAEREQRLAALEPYRVTPELMAAADPRGHLPALPARPSRRGGRREPSSTDRSPRSGSRPPTACPPSRR